METTEFVDPLSDQAMRNMNKATEQYFQDLGIDVQFNTMGFTEKLISSYLSDTQRIVDASKSHQSHHVKHQCYSQYYDFEPRTKLTGFEVFDGIKEKISIEQLSQIQMPLIPMLKFRKTESSSLQYKDALIEHLREIKNPVLLYLSGGLDSEFVARVLLEAEIPFTAVCFEWTDSIGITNLEDIKYAYDFCDRFSIPRIIRTLNIPELWTDEEFRQLGKDAGLYSPHLTTHAYMTKLIDQSLPGHTHLFGGEVRYRSDFHDETFGQVNLASFTKVNPMGFNGVTYSYNVNTVGATSTSFRLTGFFIAAPNGFTWSFSKTGDGSPVGSPPLSGNMAVSQTSTGGYKGQVYMNNESVIISTGNIVTTLLPTISGSPVSLTSGFSPILSYSGEEVRYDVDCDAGTDGTAYIEVGIFLATANEPQPPLVWDGGVPGGTYDMTAGGFCHFYLSATP